MIHKINLEIYLNGRFYGLLRTNLRGGGIFSIREEEVERRLPLLKGKNYNVTIC